MADELTRESTRAGAIEPAVYPFQYQLLYELASYGPLRAGEFTMTRRPGGSPLSTSNSLRPLVALGLIERDDGTYRLTYKALRWLELADG